MADKHAILSEEEISAAPLPAALGDFLVRLPEGAQILDWGCGRGKTVIRLRDAGRSAWGLDAAPAVLAKAGPALARRGLGEAVILRTLDEVASFPDGFFHLIFSEETLEHVDALEELAATAYRLTAAGGFGLHSFPGRRQWREPHLMIPLVHWLPWGAIRLAWLHACLFLGAGPRPPWPEVVDGDGKLLPRSGQAAVYARYLESKVHYRAIDAIASIFRRAGFQVHHRNLSPPPAWTRLLPPAWRRDGFPAGNVLLLLHKPDIIPPRASTGSTS